MNQITIEGFKVGCYFIRDQHGNRYTIQFNPTIFHSGTKSSPGWELHYDGGRYIWFNTLGEAQKYILSGAVNAPIPDDLYY